jgi:HPr kinase/phosphorylase
MPHLSAARLFDDNREKLQLEWIAGQAGATHQIAPERVSSSPEGLIGHLNLIHPNWIQVLGKTEIAYLETLDDASRIQALRHLAKTDIFCLIVTGGETAPAVLRELAETTQTPLFASPKPSVHLMWLLRYYLARALAESTVMHGVFLDVLGMGVLITGDSGVGKSELGLELISRGGSGLVADDVVELYRTAPETLEGRCPPLLKDFLEVRGLGVLDIRTIFGETSVRPRMNLKLIVHLEKPAGDGVRLERLPLAASTQTVLGVDVRKVTVPVAAGRNLAVLVEAAVRNYVLQLRGIDSTRDFIARHQQHMDLSENEQEPK